MNSLKLFNGFSGPQHTRGPSYTDSDIDRFDYNDPMLRVQQLPKQLYVEARTHDKISINDFAPQLTYLVGHCYLYHTTRSLAQDPLGCAFAISHTELKPETVHDFKWMVKVDTTPPATITVPGADTPAVSSVMIAFTASWPEMALTIGTEIDTQLYQYYNDILKQMAHMRTPDRIYHHMETALDAKVDYNQIQYIYMIERFLQMCNASAHSSTISLISGGLIQATETLFNSSPDISTLPTTCGTRHNYNNADYSRELTLNYQRNTFGMNKVGTNMGPVAWVRHALNVFERNTCMTLTPHRRPHVMSEGTRYDIDGVIVCTKEIIDVISNSSSIESRRGTLVQHRGETQFSSDDLTPMTSMATATSLKRNGVGYDFKPEEHMNIKVTTGDTDNFLFLTHKKNRYLLAEVHIGPTKVVENMKHAKLVHNAWYDEFVPTGIIFKDCYQLNGISAHHVPQETVYYDIGRNVRHTLSVSHAASFVHSVMDGYASLNNKPGVPCNLVPFPHKSWKQHTKGNIPIYLWNVIVNSGGASTTFPFGHLATAPAVRRGTNAHKMYYHNDYMIDNYYMNASIFLSNARVLYNTGTALLGISSLTFLAVNTRLINRHMMQMITPTTNGWCGEFGREFKNSPKHFVTKMKTALMSMIKGLESDRAELFVWLTIGLENNASNLRQLLASGINPGIGVNFFKRRYVETHGMVIAQPNALNIIQAMHTAHKQTYANGAKVDKIIYSGKSTFAPNSLGTPSVRSSSAYKVMTHGHDASMVFDPNDANHVDIMTDVYSGNDSTYQMSKMFFPVLVNPMQDSYILERGTSPLGRSPLQFDSQQSFDDGFFNHAVNDCLNPECFTTNLMCDNMRFNPNILGYGPDMFKKDGGLFYPYCNFVPERATIMREVKTHNKNVEYAGGNNNGYYPGKYSGTGCSLTSWSPIRSDAIACASARKCATDTQLFTSNHNINNSNAILHSATDNLGLCFAYTGSTILQGLEANTKGDF